MGQRRQAVDSFMAHKDSFGDFRGRVFFDAPGDCSSLPLFAKEQRHRGAEGSQPLWLEIRPNCL